MTTAIRPVHRKRLTKLIEFLEKLPRQKFDLTIFAKASAKEPKCGSVCCAIGWCPTVFPRQWKWRPSVSTSGQLRVTLREDEGAEDFFGAMQFFGLDLRTIYFCFVDTAYTAGANTTPKQVAKRLRAYLEDPAAVNAVAARFDNDQVARDPDPR